MAGVEGEKRGWGGEGVRVCSALDPQPGPIDPCLSPTGQAEAREAVFIGLCETWGHEQPDEGTSSDPVSGRGRQFGNIC